MRIVCPAIVLATLLLPPVRAAAADGEKDLKGHLNQLLEKQSRMKASGASEEELAGMRQRVVMAERELRVESAGRKVKHFRAAAEHLRQVGADDLALMLTEKAEVVEREARELKRQLKAAGGESRDGSADGRSLEDLRRQIERLRLELDEVARTVEELEPRNKKVDNPSPRGHETE